MALDYHCASMNLAYGTGMAIFHNMPSHWPFRRGALTAFALPYLFWVALVSYLSFFHFDFGFFMNCSVGCGVVGSFMWMAYYIRNRGHQPYAWKIIAAYWGVALVLPLELLDFPPLFNLLDAHALWHLLTVPLQCFVVSFHCDLLRHRC